VRSATGVGAVRNRARVSPGDHVVVYGAGGVGLNIIQAARLAGAGSVVAVDVNAAKLEAARRFGATHLVDGRNEDAAATIRAASHGHGADPAFESTGVASCMAASIDATRAGGTVVLLGMASQTEPLVVENVAAVILQEKVITGSLIGSGVPSRDFPQIAQDYLSGRLDIDSLVTRVRPIDEINQAIEDQAFGTELRTVFTFNTRPALTSESSKPSAD
jgi:S-(hydroxymethyl)glutathione dehydrogenase/alcohol dehydrogenase